MQTLLEKYCTIANAKQFAAAEDKEQFVRRLIQGEPEHLRDKLFGDVTDELWATMMYIERSADSDIPLNPR